MARAAITDPALPLGQEGIPTTLRCRVTQAFCLLSVRCAQDNLHPYPFDPPQCQLFSVTPTPSSLLPPLHSFLKNRLTYHTAKEERNPRTITTATEPSPTPTICCSVSDEAVGQNHTLSPQRPNHALPGGAHPPVLTPFSPQTWLHLTNHP